MITRERSEAKWREDRIEIDMINRIYRISIW